MLLGGPKRKPSTPLTVSMNEHEARTHQLNISKNIKGSRQDNHVQDNVEQAADLFNMISYNG